ncbi:unnamed protein product [Xylocopa violacea]|uniref:Uncharacterized protein n=1 Tax=Xylocopa violacea TaxID=135666 RepID=A0ABP1NZG4_XYLVO
MVSREDYSYTDTTEASNITSLQSDASCVTNANVKEPVCDPVNREGNIYQQFNYKDCKCQEVHTRHGAVTDQYGISGTVEESHKKGPSKDQSPTKQSATPCLCHARDINACTLPLKYRNDRSYPRPRWCPFKWRWLKKGRAGRKDKTYEVKLKPQKCSHYAEMDEKKKEITEKIDIYYFDHGNSA